MSQTKLEKVLTIYHDAVESVRETLYELDIPKTEAENYLIHIPNFDAMIVDDVVEFYKNIQAIVILHLRKIGLSEREITTRIGGLSHMTTHNIIKRYSPVTNLSQPSDVMEGAH